MFTGKILLVFLVCFFLSLTVSKAKHLPQHFLGHDEIQTRDKRAPRPIFDKMPFVCNDRDRKKIIAACTDRQHRSHAFINDVCQKTCAELKKQKSK